MSVPRDRAAQAGSTAPTRDAIRQGEAQEAQPPPDRVSEHGEEPGRDSSIPLAIEGASSPAAAVATTTAAARVSANLEAARADALARTNTYLRGLLDSLTEDAAAAAGGAPEERRSASSPPPSSYSGLSRALRALVDALQARDVQIQALEDDRRPVSGEGEGVATAAEALALRAEVRKGEDGSEGVRRGCSGARCQPASGAHVRLGVLLTLSNLPCSGLAFVGCLQ